VIEDIGIRDLGVIAEATLPLGPGFTAVTGETGAGKTMVITAIGLLLGARGDAGVVRAGAGQAWVDGRWRLSAGDRADRISTRVQEAGGEFEDDELILGRALMAEGRSRAVAGGRTVPLGVLAEIGDDLVVVHGQANQQRLRSSAAQREVLDRFGGPPLQRVRAEYERAYAGWRAAADELARLTEVHDERTREATELRLALDEIERLDPQPGEDTELRDRAIRLESREELRLAAAQAHDLLSSQSVADAAPDALGLLEASRRHLERVSGHDAALAPIAESLTTARYLVADAATDLASYLTNNEADGTQELDTVQNRRAELSAVTRRYGTLNEVLEFRDVGGRRLLELDSDDDRIAHLTTSVATQFAQLSDLAAQLTELRAAAAEHLASAVTEELAVLAMPDAQMSVVVEASDDLHSHGRDSVAMLLKPHPGADPRPIARGASGGELSRVMLAIEVVIAGTDPVPTFVFDEIDAGVGGGAAIEIGRRLARLAQTSQVIVVTHLAQVAAFATNHLSIVKGNDGTVTTSSVRRLRGADRESEMARLLSGLTDSASGLEHARELLAIAGSRSTDSNA